MLLRGITYYILHNQGQLLPKNMSIYLPEQTGKKTKPAQSPSISILARFSWEQRPVGPYKADFIPP